MPLIYYCCAKIEDSEIPLHVWFCDDTFETYFSADEEALLEVLPDAKANDAAGLNCSLQFRVISRNLKGNELYPVRTQTVHVILNFCFKNQREFVSSTNYVETRASTKPTCPVVYYRVHKSQATL